MTHTKNMKKILSIATAVLVFTPSLVLAQGGPGGGGDSVAPAAPTGASANATAVSGAIRVTWSAVSTNSDGSAITDLSDYRVWRSSVNDSTGFSVLTTVTAPTTTYDDSSSAVSTSYYYRVTARDTSSNESSQSASSNGVSRTSGGTSTVAGGGGGAVATTPTPSASPTPAASPTPTPTPAPGPTPAVSPSVSPTTVVEFKITLAAGATGDQVRRLQEFLKSQGTEIYPEGLVTGYLGALTKRAISRFQVKYQIAQPGEAGYGTFGPKTRAKVNSLLGGAPPAPSTPTIPTSNTKPPSGSYTKPLTVGSRNADVTALQNFLKSLGSTIYPEGLVTGNFGALTKAAVGRFQLQYGVVKSTNDPGYGYVGPMTRAKINSLLGL